MHLSFALALLALCINSTQALFYSRSEPSSSGTQAPYRYQETDLVEGKYVVKLRSGHTLEAHFDHVGRNLSTHANGFDYLEQLGSYVARLDDYTIHELVRRDPGVQYVDHVHLIHRHENTSSEGNTKRAFTKTTSPLGARDLGTKLVSQRAAPYAIVQMSNQDPLDTPVQDFSRHYTYAKAAGAGVRVYILDSGVNPDAPMFAGHIDQNESRDFTGQGSARDSISGVGHGTPVAGCVGLEGIGTAPGARLVNWRVSDGDTTDSAVLIGAINAVISEHRDFRTRNNAATLPFFWRGSVINYSFGAYRGPGGADDAVQDAISHARVEGIVFVTAAGNAGTSTQHTYPCAYDGVICVGATDESYQPATFSNYGNKISIWAPGANILSTSALFASNQPHRLAVLSGTSFAAPMVAGLAASYISVEYLVGGPPDRGVYPTDVVLNRLRANAVPGVQVPESSQNRDPNDHSTNLFAGTGAWAPGFYVDAPDSLVPPSNLQGASADPPSPTSAPPARLRPRDDAPLPTGSITSWVTQTDSITFDWLPFTTVTSLTLPPTAAAAQSTSLSDPTNASGFLSGTCNITMIQTNNTATLTNGPEVGLPPTADNLFSVTVVVTDGAGAAAANVSNTIAGDQTPLILQNKLPQQLRVTPEIGGGNYVQFNYDTLSWTSTSNSGVPGCFFVSEWVAGNTFPGYPYRVLRCAFNC